MKDDRPFVQACCVCGRVKYQNRWVNVNPVAQNKFRLSHGYCDTCYEAAMADLERRKSELIGGGSVNGIPV